MSHEKFGQNLLRHAKVFAAILGAIVALITIVGWWQGEEFRVEYANVAILNGVYLIIVFYLLWIIIDRRPPDFLGVPVVKAIHDHKILIVEGAPWLAMGVMTAIYTKEDEYERLVCTGEVVNVQANKLVQIHIRDHEEVFNDVKTVADKLEAMSKDSILVRPGLFRRNGQ